MNYRHAFHAGNFADLFKHAALTLLLLAQRRKDKPFFVLDTHAGTGLYDLEGDESKRTGEALGGVLKLSEEEWRDPLLAPLQEAIARVNPDCGRRFYPGSPEIIRGFLRKDDRMAAVELHPEDGETFKRRFSFEPRLQMVKGDGYQAMKALLPPKERRGLVLIDPPFEKPDEFQTAHRAMKEGLRRWATGCYALWFPIKNPLDVERFLQEGAQLGHPSLSAEFMLRAPDDDARLNGAGLFIVNPPWKIDQELEKLLDLLSRRLETKAPSRVRWISKDPLE